MHEEGRVGSITPMAKRCLASLLAREVDLAGVLDRQHPPAGHLGQPMRPRRGDQRPLAHALVMQKPPKRLLARFALAQALERNRSAQHQAIEQPLPLFRSRSSPNPPRSSLIAIAASCAKTAIQRITRSKPTP